MLGYVFWPWEHEAETVDGVGPSVTASSTSGGCSAVLLCCTRSAEAALRQPAPLPQPALLSCSGSGSRCIAGARSSLCADALEMQLEPCGEKCDHPCSRRIADPAHRSRTPSKRRAGNVICRDSECRYFKKQNTRTTSKSGLQRADPEKVRRGFC